jgi:branched-chain amino acid transport system permease protein
VGLVPRLDPRRRRRRRVFATLTELVLIRPLYERHIEQVLVTVGLSFAAVALFEGIWGTDAVNIAVPRG